MLRVELESDSREKFQFACKLLHELAANVLESFKQLDKRCQANVSHRFRIGRTDYNLHSLELAN